MVVLTSSSATHTHTHHQQRQDSVLAVISLIKLELMLLQTPSTHTHQNPAPCRCDTRGGKLRFWGPHSIRTAAAAGDQNLDWTKPRETERGPQLRLRPDSTQGSDSPTPIFSSSVGVHIASRGSHGQIHPQRALSRRAAAWRFPPRRSHRGEGRTLAEGAGRGKEKVRGVHRDDEVLCSCRSGPVPGDAQ